MPRVSDDTRCAEGPQNRILHPEGENTEDWPKLQGDA